MLEPERDLKGATPEKLAKALLRQVKPLRPRRVRQPVVSDEAAVKKTPADEAGDGIPHLDKGI